MSERHRRQHCISFRCTNLMPSSFLAPMYTACRTSDDICLFRRAARSAIFPALALSRQSSQDPSSENPQSNRAGTDAEHALCIIP